MFVCFSFLNFCVATPERARTKVDLPSLTLPRVPMVMVAWRSIISLSGSLNGVMAVIVVAWIWVLLEVMYGGFKFTRPGVW